MSWAGIANNQTVSLNNLIDAVANGIFSQLNPIPTGIKEITKSEAQTYVCLDTTYAPFAAKTSNQLVVKTDLVPCVTTSTTTTTTTLAGQTTTTTTSTTTSTTTLAGQTTTTTTTSTTTAAPTTTTTTSTTFLACVCHDGTINDNNSFSYYDCTGLLVTGGGELGTLICFDINRPYSGNITDNGVSVTCTCISTTTTTTTTTAAPILCGGTVSGTGGLGNYPKYQQFLMGAATGTVTVSWNTGSQPIRTIVNWNPFGINPVLDTQYRGASNYDYGGLDRTTFTASLTGKVDPITGNTYPYTSVGNAPDGYPYVLASIVGSQTWSKTNSTPTTADLYVYAPISGTRWSVTMSCAV